MDIAINFEISDNGPETSLEVTRILDKIKDQINHGETEDPIRDANGNTIGYWSLDVHEDEEDISLLVDFVANSIMLYEESIRKNMSPEWDTIKLVAECKDGIYGAFGELLDTATDYACGRELTQAEKDALQSALEEDLQPRLKAEVAAR